ncbi:MAG: imidazole glycerol phosphate synthase subunit HisF [Candidatus Kerfeldbacteria bacterium]|nr:imidazole glycerol phosphate synthase subunit HisF [Candidatus Kerfeldbacteria bacterium]
MLQTRAIPCLLKKGSSLVKTKQFGELQYIGDPVNTIQIFNNLAADEIIVLDITASVERRSPDLEFISQLTDECFMPFAYGGGVRTIDDMKRIFSLGVEKIIICSYAVESPQFIKDAALQFGNQSIIVSIDVKKNFLGRYHVYTHSATIDTKRNPVDFAQEMERSGAGEIFLNSINNDGMMHGFDLELINDISKVITIPLIACGGAGTLAHIKQAIDAGATAVAAGSLFVYQNGNRAVLINYPERQELDALFQNQ